MNQIQRVVEGKSSDELLGMIIMLLSLPRIEDRCKGLAVCPGMGEMWRMHEVINFWHHYYCNTHLLIAGAEWQKEMSAIRPPIIENLRKPPFWLQRLENVYAQEHAQHTPDQCKWIVEKVQEFNLESVALFVSPYHLPRAYLTLLKTFISMKAEPIVIIPVPVAVSPETLIPDTQVDAYGMVPGELERIRTYQEKGDVASCAELREHLKWMWQQPLLRNYRD